MNVKEKELNTSVGFRISEKEKQELENLCQVFNISKSEFLRNQINKINSVIKETPKMKNLNKQKETEQAMHQLTGNKKTVLNDENNKGETPADTVDELVDQLKNREE